METTLTFGNSNEITMVSVPIWIMKF